MRKLVGDNCPLSPSLARFLSREQLEKATESLRPRFQTSDKRGPKFILLAPNSIKISLTTLATKPNPTRPTGRCLDELVGPQFKCDTHLNCSCLSFLSLLFCLTISNQFRLAPSLFSSLRFSVFTLPTTVLLRLAPVWPSSLVSSSPKALVRTYNFEAQTKRTHTFEEAEAKDWIGRLKRPNWEKKKLKRSSEFTETREGQSFLLDRFHRFVAKVAWFESGATRTAKLFLEARFCHHFKEDEFREKVRIKLEIQALFLLWVLNSNLNCYCGFRYDELEVELILSTTESLKANEQFRRHQTSHSTCLHATLWTNSAVLLWQD